MRRTLYERGSIKKRQLEFLRTPFLFLAPWISFLTAACAAEIHLSLRVGVTDFRLRFAKTHATVGTFLRKWPSPLLPLQATKRRIQKFLQGGGNLLAWGLAIPSLQRFNPADKKSEPVWIQPQRHRNFPAPNRKANIARTVSVRTTLACQ